MFNQMVKLCLPAKKEDAQGQFCHCGYDHCFVIRPTDGGLLAVAVPTTERGHGRR